MLVKNLRRALFLRRCLDKIDSKYSESQMMLLVAINDMNESGLRCSSYSVSKFMSKIHRSPHRKTLLATLRKFRNDGVVMTYGKGAGSNSILTEFGRSKLFELEKRIKGIQVAI